MRYLIDELNSSERLSQRVCNDGKQFCAHSTRAMNQRSKPLQEATLGRTDSEDATRTFGETLLDFSPVQRQTGAVKDLAENLVGSAFTGKDTFVRSQASRTTERERRRTWCTSCRPRQRGARFRPCTRSPLAGCSPRTVRRRVVAAMRPDSVSKRRRVRRPRGGLSGQAYRGQRERFRRRQETQTSNAPMHH